MYKKVENEKDLIRDGFSKAVISNNLSAYELAKEKKEKFLKEKERINSLENRINNIEGKLNLILDKLNAS